MTQETLFSDIPEVFYKAAEQFNRFEFWECHETLESLWLKASEPQKTFLQGVIQVAAGFVHLKNANFIGMQNLLTYGLEKLHRVDHEPLCPRWIDLKTFIAQTEAAKVKAESLGENRLSQFVPNDFPNLMIIAS